VEGKRVPLCGLLELLAASRLLADTDVLGGGLRNAGFVVERDWPAGSVTPSGAAAVAAVVDRLPPPLVVRVVKVDAGEAFNFDGDNNQFSRTFNTRARGNKVCFVSVVGLRGRVCGFVWVSVRLEGARLCGGPTRVDLGVYATCATARQSLVVARRF
jgi:hypothetical protein